MATIKIIAVPSGQAPLWVRQEWVGIVLPVAENVPSITINMGVLGGEPGYSDGYSVETAVAVQELKKKSLPAAQWWEANVPAILLPWLVFQHEVCIFDPR